jgi:hypothetical protein
VKEEKLCRDNKKGNMSIKPKWKTYKSIKNGSAKTGNKKY